MAGEVVGINTMKHSGSTSGDISYESLGFAIQINDAVEIADDIIEDGEYSGNKGSATQGVKLGITCGTVVKGVEIEVAPGVKITPETDGVVVSGINEGYPCYGKLELYDVIFSFDGVKTPTIEKMRAELFKHKVGDTVIIEVWRNGELVKVEVTL
jgi:serine protease Do